ncbi:hypothetical protein L3V83_14820, partial [Thiotrichales bacterium 19X7-9]|nr:hypothetical protein [Thiotrichales bacterium 19X7-9]
NKVQLESNKDSNKVQLESNKDSNKVQLESNKDSNKVQLESNKDSNKVQLESNKDSNKVQLESNKDSNKVQLESNLFVEVLPRISTNERKILVVLIKKMIESESNCTQDMNTQELTLLVGTTINGLKTGLKRLTEKKIIQRESGKRGVGGVIKFSTSTTLKNKLLKYLADEISEFDKNLSSSIYNSNIITTIDKNKEKIKNSETNKDDLIQSMQKQIAELQQTKNNMSSTNNNTKEDDFSDVDFSELSEFGFQKSHLDQIKNFGTVTSEIAQESINHYAWALHNRKKEMQKYAPEKNRFKGLFGVLRKGNAWTEDGYIDPIDEAIQKSLDAKRKKLAQVKKQKEEMFLLDFELWKESLSEDDLNKINNQIKSKTQGRKSGAMYEAALKDHFKNNFHTSR